MALLNTRAKTFTVGTRAAAMTRGAMPAMAGAKPSTTKKTTTTS